MTTTDKLSRAVIIALTTPLGFAAQEHRSAAPLSPNEWNTVRDWLDAGSMASADLIEENGGPVSLTGIDYSLSYRMSCLLERLDDVRRAEHELAERGIWMLTSCDGSYPRRWAARLGRSAPPVLYGEGSTENLTRPALGIVGSRDISESLAEIANVLGAASVLGDYAVVSGACAGLIESA